MIKNVIKNANSTGAHFKRCLKEQARVLGGKRFQLGRGRRAQAVVSASYLLCVGSQTIFAEFGFNIGYFSQCFTKKNTKNNDVPRVKDGSADADMAKFHKNVPRVKMAPPMLTWLN